MIKGLKFENYKSFKDEHSLIFDASSNVYLVYGKNSSGKTNLYHLFKDISTLVRNTNFLDETDFNDNHNIFCKEADNNIFKLSVIFEVDSIEYGYTIHIDYLKGNIYEMLQTNEEVVYLFENEEIVSKYIDKSLVERIRTFDLKKTSLLAIFFDENISLDVTNGFNFKSLKNEFKYVFKADGLFVNKYILDDEFKENCMEQVFNEITKVDFGIDRFSIDNGKHLLDQKLSDLQFKDDKAKKEFINNLNLDMGFIKLFSHKNGLMLDYKFESRGTKLYIDYISTFICEYHINKRRVFVFDELDLALSSTLVKHLITFFKSTFKDAQLIFTTHNTNLLSANEELGLAKGNYIIVDKKEYDSKLYRLNSFEKLRDDNRNNFEKMYLNGRFGGVHEFIWENEIHWRI